MISEAQRSISSKEHYEYFEKYPNSGDRTWVCWFAVGSRVWQEIPDAWVRYQPAPGGRTTRGSRHHIGNEKTNQNSLKLTEGSREMLLVMLVRAEHMAYGFQR